MQTSLGTKDPNEDQREHTGLTIECMRPNAAHCVAARGRIGLSSTGDEYGRSALPELRIGGEDVSSWNASSDKGRKWPEDC